MRKSGEFTDGIPTLGGASWIDLLNSRLVIDAEPVDFLACDDAFCRWIAASGIDASIAASGIDASLDMTRERKSLVLLREALLPAFDALSAGQVLPQASIETVNNLLARRIVRQHIVSAASGYSLAEQARIDGPLVATLLALEFATFVTNYEAARLKRCDSEICSMRFYDRGKNNRRRWCSTSVCGNRDKVARYRARITKGSAQEASGPQERREIPLTAVSLRDAQD